MFEPDSSRYDLNPTADSVHGRIVRDLRDREGRGALLDLGCAAGYLAAEATKLGYAVTGLDRDPAALAEARERCARVVRADLDLEGWDAELRDERFEAVVAADVLQCLARPDEALRRLRPLLAEGGAVYASVPNVAHLSVRLHLLSGHFDYAPSGLLDRTHLRFFTFDSLQALFEGAGYAVDGVERVIVPQEWVSLPYDDKYLPLLTELAGDANAQTFQFLVRAYPSSTAAEVHLLRRRVREAERARETLEAQVAERTSWAQAQDAEIAKAREVIADLQRQLAERTAWAQGLDAEVARARATIADLQRPPIGRDRG